MAIPVLQPRIFWGLQTEIKGNVHFVGDEDILYPVGTVLAFHNYTQNRQKIIRLPEKTQTINLIVISPNRKVAAICEKGDKPCISIYDLTTLKKKKALFIPAGLEATPSTVTEFTTCAFTLDSKFLIAVTGEPDWMLYSYNWERGKIETSCKANNPNQTGTVVQVCCNPTDASTIGLVGETVFRLMACAESAWRQWGFGKADQLDFRCATWLSQERIIAGTSSGRIYIVDSGELKLIFNALECSAVIIKTKEEMAQASSTSLTETSVENLDVTSNSVRMILGFPKGFAYSCTTGQVFLFEKETNNRYIKRNVYKIPISTFGESAEIAALDNINCLSISPLQDRLIATTQKKQIYVVKLWGPDITLMPETLFQPLGQPLHHGSINGLALCNWKPIFMTSGEVDRTVRVWDYKTENLLLCKQYQEDVYGIALHPNGLFCCIGFSDKLRFLNVLIDDLAACREFPIRYCKTIAFSCLGHLVAAVNGTVIQVYSTVSFELLYALKGHNGKIKSLSWTATDHKLVSCGTEGAVYEWDIAGGEGRRCGEIITKTCAYMDVAFTSDGKSSFGVGSDGRVKEVSASNITRDVVIGQGSELDCLALARSDLMLFVSDLHGIIYSVKLPIMETAETIDFKLHCACLTKLALTTDDKMLISCASDGSLCIWKLVFIEGKTVKIGKDFEYFTEILISQHELQEKLREIRDLTARTHELQTEHSYQMRQTDVENDEKMKNVCENYNQIIDELKEKIENLEMEHAIEMSNTNQEIANMKLSFGQNIQKLEASFNEKLINEYDKYSRLEDKLAAVRRMYDGQLEELGKSKEDSIKDLTDSYTTLLKEKEEQIEELQEEIIQRTKEHETMKQQIEDDSDREILELRSKFESILKEEQDFNIRLKGETGVLKKKYVAAQKEIDELKHSVYTLQGEHSKYKAIIEGLEKDISDLKKEIVERDSTIQDKERRIYDLKRKNQELEKFRFVLNYKIKELKGQIEPREKEIADQKEQINEMVSELENLQRIITSLELQLTELREKLSAADHEFRIEQEKVRQCRALLRRMRTDLHDLSGLVQEPMKMKNFLKDMYHRYNEGADFSITHAEDIEAKNEFLRQREYLERTVRGLKLAAARTYTGVDPEKLRIVEESSVLISETNNLRVGLKAAQRKNHNLESVLGFTSKTILPSEAQKKLLEACKTKEEINDMYKDKITCLEKNILALKEENTRLATRIVEMKYEKNNLKESEQQ